MFNIGGGELLVILLIALIVLGPTRLPEAARQIGKVMGDLRRLSTGFQNEVKTAFDEVQAPLRDDVAKPSLGSGPAATNGRAASDAIASVSGLPTASPSDDDPQVVPKVEPPRTDG